MQLTEGSALRIASASNTDGVFNEEHILQFVSIKKVNPPTAGSGNTADRFRIILSDGQHFFQAMLATQLNHLVHNEEVTKNTIAVVDKMSGNFVQGKRLLIVMGLRVLEKFAEKIGQPQAIKTEGQPAQDSNNNNNAEANAPSTSSHAPAPPPPQPQPQAAPRQQPSAPKDQSVFPIEGLSPYQNNWKIKARVTQKSDIRTWSNQRGEGKLFSVVLMDESGEIKGTAFNASVDELYDKFQEGKVYYISKARVNLAKKKFSTLSNDYELNFDRGTEVEECLEATGVPTVKYNFTPLSNLEEVAAGSICDVIGIVKEVGSLSEINTKMNKSLTKRELTLVDRSNFSVRLTLWGKQAEQFAVEQAPVIAFKGVKVGDFGGRSLSMVSSSTMSINPDLDEAFVIRGWYDATGAEQSFQSHTHSAPSAGGSFSSFNRAEIRNLREVKESQLGTSDKADFFSTQATIMHIKSDNISYPACPTPNCNKKVVEVHDGWRCEKCDRSFEKPQHRYIMSMAVADWSGQVWLQGFNDVGEAVFGMTADQLVEIKESNDSQYNAVMHKATSSTFNFVCRAKQDTYNDQTRVRYGISKIQPLDYKEETKFLVDLLHSTWAS